MLEATIGVRLGEGMKYLNITEDVQGQVDGFGVRDGHIHVFVEHTTCTLLVQEDEPCLMSDLFKRLDKISPPSLGMSYSKIVGAPMGEDPQMYRLKYYAHDDLAVRTANLEEGIEERRNGHSHVRASLVGQPYLILRVRDGKLALGKWQQILFLDFDDLQERRERTISVGVMGS